MTKDITRIIMENIIDRLYKKYIYGSLYAYIIDHMLKDTELNICVKTCRTNFEDVNGTCVQCDGSCSKGKHMHNS